MDKKSFFSELTQRLKSKGIGEEEINKQIKQFDTFFSGLNEDDLNRELENLSNVDVVAGQICEVIGVPSNEETDLPAESLSDDDILTDFDFFDAANSFPDPLADGNNDAAAEEEKTDDDFRKRRAAKRPGNKIAETAKAIASDAESDDVKTYPDRKKEKNSATIFMDPVSITAPKRKRTIPGKPLDEKKESHKNAVRQKTLSDPIRFSELDNVVPLDQKNVIIFWVVFVITLPITLALLVGIAGVFAALFLLMAGVIAGCLISLVGIAAGGTGISILGIIYGILKFTSARAESLYEIGNAILIGGISILAGVLLYNAAIRLIPFLLKYLNVFFRFVVKKLVQLFKFIKRECTGR